MGLMKSGRASWQEEEETRKDFSIVQILQEKFFSSELIKGHSERNLIDPSLQDNVLIPDDFFKYIFHVGCAINLHSIIKLRIYIRKTNFEQKTDGYSSRL